MLSRAKELSEFRNFIAHNPLVLQIIEDQDGSIFHQEVISNIHKGKVISFEELKNFSDESKLLASELFNTSSEVFKIHQRL